MIIRNFAQNIKQRDWFTVIIELLVVVVGLVFAFQVDRWWEERGNRLDEAAYISKLISDIEEDIPDLEYAISLAEVRRDFGSFLVEVAADPAIALSRPSYFLAAVLQAAYTYTPVLASHTFEDLRSTGNLKLIQDHEIRKELRSYYNYDQNQRQFLGLNLMVEYRYFELSAGVLNLEQFMFVQEHWYVVNSSNLDELQNTKTDAVGVKAAAERLHANTKLITWLPKTHGLQIDQIKVHKIRLENAQSLLNALHNYATRIERLN